MKLKKIILVQTLLVLLSACSTQSETIEIQCPEDWTCETKEQSATNLNTGSKINIFQLTEGTPEESMENKINKLLEGHDIWTRDVIGSYEWNSGTSAKLIQDIQTGETWWISAYSNNENIILCEAKINPDFISEDRASSEKICSSVSN